MSTDYRPNTPKEKFEAFLVTSGLAAIILTAILAACGLILAGCAVAPPPVVTPPVVQIDPQAVKVCGDLWRDELGREIDPIASDDCASFLSRGLRTLEDYRATIRAGEEYAAYRARLDAEKVPALSRLRLAGRHGLVNASSAMVPWTAVTGFRLVEQVAHGRQGEASAFLNSLGPARGVRVLLMARWLFQLSPDEGLAALSATLDLAQRHGRYLEVTIFADTKSLPLADADYRRIADHVGAVCASHVACGLVEIANEVWSLHETQADALGDLAFLRSLRETVRRHGDIPVSLGSTHAGEDESDRMQDGDYLTIHGDRSESDGPWRPIRHTNEQRAMADRLGKWVVNDEPARSNLSCDWHLGMALLTRLFSLGDTFHSAAGLQAQPFTGGEAQAFACRARGWQAVPDDWQGRYYNAGFAGSPVKSFDGAVRAYSSVNGGRAYTLVLGATPSLRIDWAPDWPNRELIINERGAQLYAVSR